ncbi:MAG: protein phosphatase 2C domain-containing protein [Aquincola sp.]|nr:protein phosphatase 2C domain-containing protein [Aquincola sp.]
MDLGLGLISSAPMSSVQYQGAGWRLSAASVRGKSHIDADLPNQDSVHVATSEAGDVVCAVVADGAGSAPRSGEGSTLASKHIAAYMCNFGISRSGSQPTVDEFRFAVERSIEEVRTALATEGAPLSQFHSTCVVWLALPTKAYIAQIGDSVAMSTLFGWAGEAGDEVDFFPEGRHTVHEADRGEYANETHFLTECDWRAHLRVAEVDPKVDAVLLMTDGAMDVALVRGQVFRGFLSNLVGKLLTLDERAERDQSLEAWLGAPQTYPLTGDDKTIFVAIRSTATDWTGHPICLSQEATITEAG